MKNRLVLTLLAATVALGLTAGAAMAGHRYTASLTVPTLTSNPNDLHVTFTGTGGNMTAIIVTPAPATIGTSGNTVDVTWGAPLTPSTPVTISFVCPHGPIGVAGGIWTDDGDEVGSIDPEDVTLAVDDHDVPGASPLVMALIALLIAGSGVFMIRRRAEA